MLTHRDLIGLGQGHWEGASGKVRGWLQFQLRSSKRKIVPPDQRAQVLPDTTFGYLQSEMMRLRSLVRGPLIEGIRNRRSLP